MLALSMMMNVVSNPTSKENIGILPLFLNLCSASATCSGVSIPAAGMTAMHLK